MYFGRRKIDFFYKIQKVAGNEKSFRYLGELAKFKLDKLLSKVSNCRYCCTPNKAEYFTKGSKLSEALSFLILKVVRLETSGQ